MTGKKAQVGGVYTATVIAVADALTDIRSILIDMNQRQVTDASVDSLIELSVAQAELEHLREDYATLLRYFQRMAVKYRKEVAKAASLQKRIAELTQPTPLIEDH